LNIKKTTSQTTQTEVDCVAGDVEVSQNPFKCRKRQIQDHHGPAVAEILIEDSTDSQAVIVEEQVIAESDDGPSTDVGPTRPGSWSYNRYRRK